MFQTLIILYALNAIAPIPSELFCITWVLAILKTLAEFAVDVVKKMRGES